jgi:hypothetical protein
MRHQLVTRPRPTQLIEVAERAGVSLTTASKAINGKNRVSEATRARVAVDAPVAPARVVTGHLRHQRPGKAGRPGWQSRRMRPALGIGRPD